MSGRAALDFSATLSSGEPADVIWSLAGGDAVAGAGVITARGAYTPPSYLTADRVEVVVTGALKGQPQIRASASVIVAPGFQQPLTPQNAVLGPGGTVTVSGTLAEAGGGASIQFVLSNTPSGLTGGAGSLSTPLCQRSANPYILFRHLHSAGKCAQFSSNIYRSHYKRIHCTHRGRSAPGPNDHFQHPCQPPDAACNPDGSWQFWRQQQ